MQQETNDWCAIAAAAAAAAGGGILNSQVLFLAFSLSLTFLSNATQSRMRCDPPAA